MISARTALISASILGALAVVLGAFGAHALAALLERTGRTGTWETATLYHLVHAAVLTGLAAFRPWARARAAWLCLCAGLLIFSGSLYLLCLSGITWLGAITPIGGLLMIVGWLLIVRCAATLASEAD